MVTLTDYFLTCVPEIYLRISALTYIRDDLRLAHLRQKQKRSRDKLVETFLSPNVKVQVG